MFCERIFTYVPCTISTGICHTNFQPTDYLPNFFVFFFKEIATQHLPEEKFELVTDWLSNKKPPYWVVV